VTAVLLPAAKIVKVYGIFSFLVLTLSSVNN